MPIATLLARYMLVFCSPEFGDCPVGAGVVCYGEVENRYCTGL